MGVRIDATRAHPEHPARSGIFTLVDEINDANATYSWA